MWNSGDVKWNLDWLPWVIGFAIFGVAAFALGGIGGIVWLIINHIKII